MTAVTIPAQTNGRGEFLEASVYVYIVDGTGRDRRKRQAWRVSDDGPIAEFESFELGSGGLSIDLDPTSDVSLRSDETPYYEIQIEWRTGVYESWIVQVPDAGPVSLADLVGAAGIEPGSLLADRLLPADATTGQVAVKQGDGSWAGETLSGTAVDIEQYEIAGRIAAGTGGYSGLAPGDLSEEATPAAGDLLLGWVAGGELRKFDVGNLSSGGGVSDHGGMSGLGDDDHTQYHTDARGDARYALIGHDHDTDYEPIGGGVAAVAAHELAGDPHPGYALETALGTAAAADTGDFATAAQGGLADTAIQAADLSGYVANALFDANTILAATTDNTPVAVTVAEQTLVGRITSGAIDDLSATQVRTLLNVEDGATASGATGDAFASSHPGGNQHIDWTSDQGATDIHSGNIPDLSATYATAAKGVTNGDSHDHSGGDGAQIAYSSLSGTPTLGGAAALNVGTTTGTVAAGDDSRLSDARTPTAHASTHSAGQSDAIDAADLGSGAATDGYVLTADGAGGAAWEASAGGGGSWDGDIADIDLDGGTDIGAALADADLILVDDGASGTNRKATMSRVRTYIRLVQSAQTITTADVTGAVNTHYLCTIAGLTANRNLTLPTATAGDRIRVTVVDGDADYALILLGAATVTINGGSAATEWSRLFIAGESVEFEATSATNWQVLVDKRIKQYGRIYRTSAQSNILASTNVLVENDNADAANIGVIVDLATTYSITVRRSGVYLCVGGTRFSVLNTASENAQIWFSISGNDEDPRSGRTSQFCGGTFNMPATFFHFNLISLSAGEYIALYVYQNNDNTVDLGTADWNYPYLKITEVL